MTLDIMLSKNEEYQMRSAVAASWAQQTMLTPDLYDRHEYFLSLIDQARPRKLHYEQWRQEVFNHLIEEWEDSNYSNIGPESRIATAYFHTYEAILHGMRPAMWDH